MNCPSDGRTKISSHFAINKLVSRISDFDSIGAAYQRFYTRVGCGQRSAMPHARHWRARRVTRGTACQYYTNIIERILLTLTAGFSHKIHQISNICSLGCQHNFSNNLHSDRIESETWCYLVLAVPRAGNQLSYPDS